METKTLLTVLSVTVTLATGCTSYKDVQSECIYQAAKTASLEAYEQVYSEDHVLLDSTRNDIKNVPIYLVGHDDLAQECMVALPHHAAACNFYGEIYIGLDWYHPDTKDFVESTQKDRIGVACHEIMHEISYLQNPTDVINDIDKWDFYHSNEKIWKIALPIAQELANDLAVTCSNK